MDVFIHPLGYVEYCSLALKAKACVPKGLSWQGREGIIVYECASHPSNVKNFIFYRFVVDSSQIDVE